jgi:hypothetical protein
MDKIQERINQLLALTADEMQDSLSEREDWEKKPASTGEIYYVKRKGWKNAGGFSENETRKGHPALVTNHCPKGKDVMKAVPGSTVKKANKHLFIPKKKIKYFKRVFNKKGSNYVLNYWRSVSRKQSITPYQVGEIHEDDKSRLKSEISKFSISGRVST